MKRVIAFALSLILLFLILLPTVSAADAEVSEAEKLKNAAVFSCVYSEKERQIVIEGTVNHDVMLNHRDYTIKVYSFSADTSYEEYAQRVDKEVLASANMTIKFTFHIDALTINERFAKYALVFCSPDGQEFLVGSPMLPSVSSEFEYSPSDRTGFKGILINNPTKIETSGAGTVVVDVHLDNAFSHNSNSIIYPINGTSVYFGRDFVSDIDKKVVEAYASGGRVYLRFLINASNQQLSAAYVENDDRLSIPNLYSDTALNMIYAASSFFSARYDGTNGELSGVILGSKIDDVYYTNSIGSMSLEEYADLYTMYLVVVAGAMRSTNPALDVVIPLSDHNDYSGSSDRAFGSDKLLEQIVERLDNAVSGDFDCSVMIQSDYIPFGISISGINEGIDMTVRDNSLIHAGNMGEFCSYLDNLAKKYSSYPSNIIYMWEQPSDLHGNALGCAYAYNYYKLYANDKVSSFVLCVDDGSADAYRGIEHIVRYIDTGSADDYVGPLKEYFASGSWSEIVGAEVKVDAKYILIEQEMTSNKKDGIIGEFAYIDFSNSSVINYIHKGSNTEYIRYEYDGIDKRTMKIASTPIGVGESFGCVGLYEYSEGYAYTPWMSLKLRVDGGTPGALYEITVVFGSGRDRIVANGVVTDNEISTMYFDASEYSAAYMADNIRISVRALTDGAKECVLWLYDLSGYSEVYTSEKLKTLVEEQRRKIRNPDGEEGDVWNSKMIITVIGVVLAVIAVGIGLLVAFKREDNKNKE